MKYTLRLFSTILTDGKPPPESPSGPVCVWISTVCPSPALWRAFLIELLLWPQHSGRQPGSLILSACTVKHNCLPGLSHYTVLNSGIVLCWLYFIYIGMRPYDMSYAPSRARILSYPRLSRCSLNICWLIALKKSCEVFVFWKSFGKGNNSASSL